MAVVKFFSLSALAISEQFSLSTEKRVVVPQKEKKKKEWFKENKEKRGERISEHFCSEPIKLLPPFLNNNCDCRYACHKFDLITFLSSNNFLKNYPLHSLLIAILKYS